VVRRTELEFTSPYGLWRIIDEAFCKVALYTADHVVVC
jgi:hypothetical protein